MPEGPFTLIMESEPATETGPLAEWARCQELDLVRIPETGDAERILGEVAVHVFDSPDLAKLFRDMSWKLNNDRQDARVRLTGDESSRVAFHAATERLARLGYLTRTSQKGDVFSATIPSPGQGMVDRRLSQFLSGGWLEAGALTLAERVLTSSEVTLHPNVEVNAGGRKAEFDLLALSNASATPLVVECKSGGDVEQYFLRFAAISRMAGVSGSNAVLLVRAIDPQTAADASCLHDITILTPDEFGSHLRELFRIASPEPTFVTEQVAS
jgi:hypothetical protein